MADERATPTPGPWEVIRTPVGNCLAAVLPSVGGEFLYVRSHVAGGDHKANAGLFADAPALLDALEELMGLRVYLSEASIEEISALSEKVRPVEDTARALLRKHGRLP